MAKEAIVWDSCVIIDAIQKTEGRYQYIEPMITKAQKGELLIVISLHSVTEVLYLRDLASQGMPQSQQDDLIAQWLGNSYILKRTADTPIVDKARRLRITHQGLTQTDAIILATALVNNVDTLVTYDNNGKKGRVSLLGLDGVIGDPPLRIKTPDEFSLQGEIIYPQGDESIN